MGKKILLFVLLFGVQSFLWSNPIVRIPIAVFSELVFDSTNNWRMELYFPVEYGGIDSVVINVSGISSKVKVSYSDTSHIAVITSDSLTIPLSINREGDKIIVYTYAPIHYIDTPNPRQNIIIFGDYPGASVGKPDSGYSILRYYTQLPSTNYVYFDCLTKNPSLGFVNDTVGLAGKLKGHIYDNNNKLIKGNFTPAGGAGYFYFESQLNISPDGSFTTSIFNNIENDYIFIQYWDFSGCSNTLKIQPMGLNNIHPDTIVYNDIHIIDTCPDCSLVDAVKNEVIPKNDELTVINYPNPSNQTTSFFIKVPNYMRGKQGNINIYNIRGLLIRSLPVSGTSTISWDSKNTNGLSMPSGIYYYSFIMGSQVVKSGSIILLK